MMLYVESNWCFTREKIDYHKHKNETNLILIRRYLANAVFRDIIASFRKCCNCFCCCAILTNKTPWSWRSSNVVVKILLKTEIKIVNFLSSLDILACLWNCYELMNSWKWTFPWWNWYELIIISIINSMFEFQPGLEFYSFSPGWDSRVTQKSFSPGWNSSPGWVSARLRVTTP